MGNKLVATLSFLTILTILGPYEVGADSFYSSIGMGLPRYAVSAKAVGMGGAGIAVVDRLALNPINAAANNVEGMVSLGIGLEYEYVENKTPSSSSFTKNGNASGMLFILPIQKNTTLLTMLRPLMTSRYTMSADLSIDQDGYQRQVQGSGGISAASIGLQYWHRKRLALAAQADVLFGSYNEQWKTDFITTDFRDTKEDFNSFLWGIGFDAGILFRVSKMLSLGAMYRSGAELHLENRAILGSGKSIESDELVRRLHYPSSIGAGFSLDVHRWLFAMDYYTQSWNNYKVDGAATDYKPFWRLSSGLEYQVSKDPFERYHRRVAYRIGVYHAQLPFTNEMGDAVYETFFSVGLGLPFSQTVGRVDFAIEVGQRGEVTHFLYQERLVRFSASIVSGERWFQRRY